MVDAAQSGKKAAWPVGSALFGLALLVAPGWTAADQPTSAAGAPVVAAPSPAPTTVEGLTVHPEDKPRSIYLKAMDFVSVHGGAARVGQLARWDDEICPITLGLSPAMNAFVTARVKAVALEVGAPVSKNPKCKPNVEVLFSAEPQKLVDRVARDQGALLGFHYASQTKDLTKVSRPIQAWYLTMTRNWKGEKALDVDHGITGSVNMANGATKATVGSDLPAMRNMGQWPEGCAGSSFTHCLRSNFYHVLIVADNNTLGGREIGPVSDYISLLALSQSSSLDGCNELPSILDILSTKCSGDASVKSLTATDLAYLKGLYSTDLETIFTLEKSQIADIMMRDSAIADAH